MPPGHDTTHTSLEPTAAALPACTPELLARARDAALSSIEDFAYTFDRAGRFLFVNKPLLDLWGLQLEEAVGKDFFDLQYPNDLAGTLQRQIQEVIATGKTVTDETPYSSPTGASGFYEYIFTPVFDSKGAVEFVAGSTRDITLRKRNEAALQASEERLRLATDAAEIGIWVWHVADDKVTWENDWPYELFGIARSEGPVSGQRFIRDFLHPQDVEAFVRATIETMERHSRFYFVGRFRRTDGAMRWAEFTGRLELAEDGAPVRIVGTAADVTERKQAEEREQLVAAEMSARAEANLKFRTFFEQGTQFAGVMALDGTLMEANRLSLEACGFTREQVVGRKFWECPWWSPDPDLAAIIKEASLAAAAGQVAQSELHYFVADGSRRYVALTIAPVKDDAGRVLFVAPTGTDITDKKLIADEREHLLDAERAARAQAERTSQMKDEFLATVSHELRTPLSAILGWTQLINRADIPREELQLGLDTIKRNAQVQAQLIEDLLDMSRIISGKLRLDVLAIRPTTFIEAALETVTPAAGAKGIALAKVLDDEAGPIWGDANRLQQVVWNLLSNAIKFTPQGGQVQVRLEQQGDDVVVAVTDTGHGIAADFLPHVFDRFRQADASTSRKVSGLGLGLSIVKQLVELHGGTVGVHSDGENCGTTFSLRLPAKTTYAAAHDETTQTHAPREAPTAYPSVNLAGLRILVVDDEADGREVLRRILEDCEAQVVTATSAEEALAMIESLPLDVLVSDIGMPEVDGYEFLRRVRALGRGAGGGISAVALTAFARNEDREKALQAGYGAHVAKPANPAELVGAIAEVAGRTGGAT